MKRVFFYITIVFFLLDSKARAQNLVLNPSFENLTIDCCDYPLGTNPYLMLQYWTNANSPTGYSMADLSHRCLSCVIPSYSLPEYAPLGQQNPRTGNGFAGQYTIDYENFPPMFSEYIQGKLSSPLSSNRTYIVSIWISLADMVNYTYADYGIYFSNSQLNENSLFLDYLSPQITLDSYISKRDGWQNFKYYFNAMGGESFFSFGTFIPYDQLDTLMMICDSINPNSCYNKSYIHLDDVAIYPADAPLYVADAGGDQLLCKGESAALGSASRSQYLYWWYDEQGNLIDTTAQIIVSPDSTTFYVLQQKDFKFDETSDTVVVYVSNCENPLYIPNIFSPNADGNNDVFRVRGEGISEIKTFLIYNRWGEEVFKCHTERSRSAALEDCGWDGTCRGEPAPQAVYTYYVEAVLLNGETVVKRGNVTLVR